MTGPDPPHEALDPSRSRYRVELLANVAATRRGLVHAAPDGEGLLPWAEVGFAFAAAVGEPDGVRTVVFDLLIERSEGQLRVGRFDADPWGDAIPLASALVGELPRARVDHALIGLAGDGIALACYPDLEAFELAARERFEKA